MINIYANQVTEKNEFEFQCSNEIIFVFDPKKIIPAVIGSFREINSQRNIQESNKDT